MKKVVYNDGSFILAPITWEYENDANYKETVEASPIEVHNWILELNNKIHSLETEKQALKTALKTCKHDYWFMTNLIERNSIDKNQTLHDCAERMKFRGPIFNILEEKQGNKK